MYIYIYTILGTELFGIFLGHFTFFGGIFFSPFPGQQRRFLNGLQSLGAALTSLRAGFLGRKS
jgi:hypothetical protein